MTPEEIEKHLGNNKQINTLRNELVFEISRDFADPI